MNSRTFSRLAFATAACAAAVLILRAQPAPAPAAASSATTPAPATVQAQDTIVTSDRLEMKNTGVESHLVFIGNVHLSGTNLSVTCDRVEIYAEQIPDVRDPQKKATIGKIGAITKILALGHVVISQEGRKATAGRADVMPIEDQIILTEDPVVTDTETQVTVSGTRMTFFRGERAAQVENPKVVGPALPNLGFPREQKAAEGEASTETPAATPAQASSGAAPAATTPPATKPPAGQVPATKSKP